MAEPVFLLPMEKPPRPLTVLAMPRFDPAHGRVRLDDVPYGSTLEELIEMALPGATPEQRRGGRLWLDGNVIYPEVWHCVRPKPGAEIVWRVDPRKGNLGTILGIAITVAALLTAQVYAVPIAGALFGVGATGEASALAVAGVKAAILIAGSVASALVANAFAPPRETSDQAKASPTEGIGWQNVFPIEKPIPYGFGDHRHAPPFAAQSELYVKDNKLCERALFCFGVGPNKVRNPRIGETPLGVAETIAPGHYRSSAFETLQYQVREGWPTDDPVTLYGPGHWLSEYVKVTLTHPDGEDAMPIVRSTARDCTSHKSILLFPAGLVRYNADGDKKSKTIHARWEHRVTGATTWTLGEEIAFTAKTEAPVFREVVHSFGDRNQHDIRWTRLEFDSDSQSGRTQIDWLYLLGHRPEPPLNVGIPLTLLALDAQLTDQLVGEVSTLSADVSRIARDWDAGSNSFVVRETRTIASAYLQMLQGPAIENPAIDDEIHLDLVKGLDAYGRAKSLNYDRIHDFEGNVRDGLKDVCAAGRATLHDDGLKLGVVIDRPRTIVEDHIGIVNSTEFEGTITWPEAIDAFNISFLDRTNGFRRASRLVKRPGFTGDPQRTMALNPPGVTHPDAIYVEGYRQHLNLQKRKERFVFSQSGDWRVCARGSLALLMHDLVDEKITPARVVHVDAAASKVTLDNLMAMETGENYAARFRTITPDDAAQGRPFLTLNRAVVNEPGQTQIITLDATGALPNAGDLMHFGPTEPREIVIQEIEPGPNMSARLIGVDHASDIDAILDTLVIPVWTGRPTAEGSEVAEQAPTVPEITLIESGADVGGDLVVTLRATSTIPVATFHVQHRKQGASVWNDKSAPASGGAVRVLAADLTYVKGDTIEVRAQALSAGALASAYTAIETHVFAADDLVAPTGITPAIEFDVVGGAVTSFIYVAWTGVSGNDGYEVEYGPQAGGPTSVVTVATNAIDAVTPYVSDTVSYRVRMRTLRGSLKSTPSAWVNVPDATLAAVDANNIAQVDAVTLARTT